ncbi:MAG: ABC transporter permease subunit, partial [Bacteroidia bacterium]|nr:ABC transporter permease subunit [Bacteroidia bacterium]
SKKEFILSKFYTIVFFSLAATILIGLATLLIGLYYSSYNEFRIIIMEIEFLLAYFVKLVGFFSFCLFTAMWIKRSAFALAFLFITFILEWIFFGLIAWQADSTDIAEKVQNFFPLKSMYKLIDQPIQRIVMTKFPEKTEIAYDYAVHFHEIAIVLAWTALFIFLSFRLLKKRDL